MTVRLSDAATEHVDALVAEGVFASRASYLTWLVEREAQRKAAWQEVVQLRREGRLHDPEADLIVKAAAAGRHDHLGL